MKLLLIVFTLPILAISLPVCGENRVPTHRSEPPKSIHTFNPQEGDTVVFLGDSITHQCLYTQYLETFFYTRFPERRIRFHNAGVAGDKVGDALIRFEEDVASMSPSFVFILLGMNDGQYESFSAETNATYEKGMAELLDRINHLGATAILLSPTMFDHHQLALRRNDETFRFRDKEFDPSYNALLAYYGATARELAASRSLRFVDLWSPLNDYTMANRSLEADFTLIEDAIHPGAAGHFVMTFEILVATHTERPAVSDIVVRRGKGGWKAANKENVTNLDPSLSGDELQFTFEARSLPWLVPENASEVNLRWGPSAPAELGATLTQAAHRLGLETLQVKGLRPGTYELMIDGSKIGEFSHHQLASKLELQEFGPSPQALQALAVANLNRTRNDEAIRPIRDLWSQIKGLRKKGEGSLEQQLPKILDQIEEKKKLAMQIEKKIYLVNQPKPRQYHLRRLNEKSSVSAPGPDE
ncbi:MAG: SGNH/GDSL hydrolase family protein [Verrucomicrobiota bacterium]